ncbi:MULTISPECIES: glycosyltransferase family A protein [unclassified Leptolyngbya]|uniref:glycosyltransferase family 2 protein n=1 Tax=unclassified Leptolyngbya TaxID=2650499 RepID=UPI0016869BA6|nr:MULTISPECIES: glycosyltransferase family A protein [unclassified Leptolyngbya]MBD1909056.1 glycosyltransferase family 2 protein [Leptolyngbya sp. FACHB-8]MBD2157437.1 glycosyltransferase family 2 protein [Leptolyngbya sp. FACHB-16]
MSPLPLTIIIESQDETSTVEMKKCLQPLWQQIECVLLLRHPITGQSISNSGLPDDVKWQYVNPIGMDEAIAQISTPLVGYIPAGGLPASQLPALSGHSCIAPWLLEQTLPLETAYEEAIAGLPWVAHTHLLKAAHSIYSSEDWTFLNLVHHLEKQQIRFCWGTAKASIQHWNVEAERKRNEEITPTVLALIPHYHCERWLAQCLQSLVDQTHPLDGIVVIDDGSGDPPTHIVEQFPSVTLMASNQRVGPYRLIQQVIQQTHYWAYLFQDADDWSSCARLERLLHAATQTGAELIGAQELRILEETNILPVRYPLDVNQALSEKPGHGLLHPSSLVTRDLVLRLGGFATGLQFGADTEFLLRAIFAARIANIPDYAYFRRKRPGSLTTHPDTSLDSPARLTLLQECKARARANYAALKSGQTPDLSPLVCSGPIHLDHITGPILFHSYSEAHV